MEFEARTVRNIINKAYLKEPIERGDFERFKESLQRLLNEIDQASEADEHEEHFKNHLPDFFKSIGFGDYKINTSNRIDLAIYNGSKTKDPVGVIMEVKRPSNQGEMISKGNLEKKAMFEAVLYYLEQRIGEKNSDVKHVIITNMSDWFIFDAQEFERCFYKPNRLKKSYKEWKANRKVSSNNDFIYSEIESYIRDSDLTIRGVYLPLKPVRKLLKGGEDSSYEKRLIALYKFFSPIHLLKEPFANDSNSLNKEFYRELLYILGLQETKEGNTRYIRRAEEGKRENGSLIENTIRILESENRLSSMRGARSSYGSTPDEQLFNVAMELCITWVNRILFLKLLEAQLYRYHREDRLFKFLHYGVIDDFDELNKLFFQVLARKESDRSPDINENFGHIPYLNSSLFDVSELEHQTITISNLDDHSTLPVYGKSVLNDLRGESLNSLEYLFRFLEAYDFSAEGSEEIRDESKSLINASVLGLIFEKINGYKEGSFYTPGFITEYMARETLRRAVVDAFNEAYNWTCKTLEEVEEEVHRDRIGYAEANAVINNLKICDPAVGSGHFLVSCLNELIAIKSELRILCDPEWKVLRNVNVSVENDELIVSWEEEELFEYDVSHTWQGSNKLKKRQVSPEKDRVQRALFHEKRILIENCLFGVDINPNSVKICRLRLWIELLKRAYYTPESKYMELEVLPNIDINIKQGNSLVSRFDLDADLSSVFKQSEYSVEDYKKAVKRYKESGDREEKGKLQQVINQIKEEYSLTLHNNRPINRKLSKARGQLEIMQSDDLFGDMKFTKKQIRVQKKKLKKLEKQKAEEESGAFYNEAFEWRFEFPEVLDEEGRFTGFDVVIGNPPYVRQEQFSDLKPYLKQRFSVYYGTADLYSYFIERGMQLLRDGGHFQYIVANKWMRANYGEPLRTWLKESVNIDAIYDFGDLPVFEEATTYPCLLQLSKLEPTDSFMAAEVESLEFDELRGYLNEIRFRSDQSKLQDGGWALIDEKAQRLLEKLKKTGTPLGEYVDGNIYYGIKTGFNKAFVIDEETKEQLIEQDPKSAEIIKPYLAGRDIKRYQMPEQNNYLILIPKGYTNENRGQRVAWSWLTETYPAISEHLKKYEDKAKKRYDQGEYWWELRACDYYEEFEKPKILLPDISLRGNFTLDKDGGLYAVNTAYIIGSDEKFLLGILASDLIQFYYKSISSTYRGGYLRFIYQYLETIPIVEPEAETKKVMESKVDEILAKNAEGKASNTSELEQEIDQMVYKLYGLSEEEIEVVEENSI